MFMQLFFSKVHPACTVSNQEVTLKTDKHAALGCKRIYVRCMNSTYKNVAKGIRLPDKKAFFIYTGKLYEVRAFERYIPLKG